MDNNQDSNQSENKNNPNKFNINSYWIYGLIILGILAVNFYVSFNSQIEQIDLYAFEDKVKAKSMGAKAAEVINTNRGALDKTVSVIESYL